MADESIIDLTDTDSEDEGPNQKPILNDDEDTMLIDIAQVKIEPNTRNSFHNILQQQVDIPQNYNLDLIQDTNRDTAQESTTRAKKRSTILPKESSIKKTKKNDKDIITEDNNTGDVITGDGKKGDGKTEHVKKGETKPITNIEPKAERGIKTTNKHLQAIIKDDLAFDIGIHPELAEAWEDLLKHRELSSQIKIKYNKIPKNCNMLKAPILNKEIESVVSRAKLQQDKRYEQKQNLLGMSIVSFGKALSLLKPDDNQTVTEEYINNAYDSIENGCRLLIKLHCEETELRRTALNLNKRNKDMWAAIERLERDETLFGKHLAKKLKGLKRKHRS